MRNDAAAPAWRVEDLGEQARGNLWMNFRHGIRPHDGAEIALCALSLGGVVIIDPAARTSRQVTSDNLAVQGWAIGQGPDGTIWQTGFIARRKAELRRWQWQGDSSTVVMELPGGSFFTLDVGPDGVVYLPDHKSNTLYAYDPAREALDTVATFEAYGKNVRNVYVATDGWIYVTVVDGGSHTLVAMDPKTRTPRPLKTPHTNSKDWQSRHIVKDADGRILAGAMLWGNQAWFELNAGTISDIPCAKVRLAATSIRQSSKPASSSPTAFAFADGSYISSLDDTTVTVTSATGTHHRFDHHRIDMPLRIFSIYSGGGKIWGGTFIPLTLFSYDPATGESRSYGNPTRSTGEIYGFAWSRDQLYIASYTSAAITRYTPKLPWQPQAAIPNPIHLGLMKEDGSQLHRIYGQAVAPDGSVFFAAKGDYGCNDSGIVRLSPESNEMTRWIYPDTTFGALCYLEGLGQLLVAECRHDEKTIRFTRIDPTDGTIIASVSIIADEGAIISLLPAKDGHVYGLHNHRATLFLCDPVTGTIRASAPELKVGDHCYNALIDGPDGRIWGLTNRCVYALSRDLSQTEEVVAYPDLAGGNFYRFGLTIGPDGAVYFANGSHLMRIPCASTER